MRFPYPSPGDRPCDFDEQWCQFTGAVDQMFDRWEAGLARAYPAIPAAKLRQTELTPLLNFSPIPMSEVSLDTAGMTNLDADPYGITVRRAGRYTIWATILENDATGGAGGQSQLFIDVQSAVEANSVLVLGPGQYRNVTYWPAITLAAGSRVTMFGFLSGQASRTLNGASLAVFWHSDTVRP